MRSWITHAVAFCAGFTACLALLAWAELEDTEE